MSGLIAWIKEHWPRFKTYWTERGVIPRWQYVLVYAVIVGAGAFGLSKTSDAVDAVQQSRLELCEDANQRHDNTIAALDAQIALLPPRERRRAKARREATVALLEALAPHRDCKRALRPHKP